MEVFLYDPLQIAPVWRGILDRHPQFLDKAVGNASFYLTTVCKDRSGQVLAWPFFHADVDPERLAVVHRVFSRIHDRHGGTPPGRRIQGHMHTHDHPGSGVLDEIQGRPSDDGAAVILAHQVYIGDLRLKDSGCRVHGHI